MRDVHLFICGATALFAGVLVYVVVRPLAPALSGPLPTFAHVIAFCLMSAAVLACGKHGALRVCALWALVEIAFEIGQHARIAPSLTAIDATYFAAGTFAPSDLAAAVLGAALAYRVISMKEES